MADVVGCGLGASTILMAQEYGRSHFVASDYHDESIDGARKRAADAGVGERVTFEVASTQTFGGTGYELVTTLDCLHDMGDPLGAARHVREALDSKGSWLVVKPFAGDSVAANLNPVWGGSTTRSRPAWACRTRSRSRVATRWAPRRARRASARS